MRPTLQAIENEHGYARPGCCHCRWYAAPLAWQMDQLDAVQHLPGCSRQQTYMAVSHWLVMCTCTQVPVAPARLNARLTQNSRPDCLLHL